MTPQPINKTVTANTTNLLLSAKSTRVRIMSWFLFCRCLSQVATLGLQSLSKHVVQDQRVRDHLLSWLEPRLDLLQIHVVRQEVSTDDLQAAKLLVFRGNENKIAIVHVQDGGCRNDGVHLGGLTAEGGLHEHAQPQNSGIPNFNSNFGCANIRIEDGTNVADRSLEYVIGIRVWADLRGVANPDMGEVVLVHVADNPDGRKVRNCERI